MNKLSLVTLAVAALLPCEYAIAQAKEKWQYLERWTCRKNNNSLLAFQNEVEATNKLAWKEGYELVSLAHVPGDKPELPCVYAVYRRRQEG